jgi:hypothetical protein
LPPVAPAPSTGKFVCTPEEKTRLVQIASIKKAALSGDRKAQKQWKKLCKRLPKLQKSAAKGNPKSQRNLQCLRSSKLFASPVAMRGEFVGKRQRNRSQKEFVGAYATQILGRSLNDDEAAVAQEGGSSERESFSRMRGLGGIVIEDKEIKSAIDGWISGQNWNQPGYRGRSGRRGNRVQHLKKIVRSAARGNVQNTAKLERIKQKLNTRAAAGDARATTMLQNIQKWFDAYRNQVTTTALPTGVPPVISPTYPAYPAYTPPAPTQTYPTQTYYPSAPSGYVPGADNEDYEE